MNMLSRRGFLKSTAAVGTAGVLDGLFISRESFAAAETKAPVSGLRCAVIYSADMDKSLTFYKNALGMKTVSAGPGVSLMKLNEFAVKLVKADNPSQVEAAARGTQNHICLRTNDAHGMFAAMKKGGVEIEVEPFDAKMPFDRPLTQKGVFTRHTANDTDLRLFFVRGPSGERFEIMQDDIKAAPGKPSLSGIHHSGVYVRDVDEAVKFYGEKMGFKLLYKTDAMEGDKPLKMGWIWLNGFAIELLQPEDVSKIVSGAEACPNYISLSVSGLGASAGALQNFMEKKETEKGGFFMRGPNGERYEITDKKTVS